MDGQRAWPPEAPRILGDVRDAIVETAGSELVGLYLHGSLVTGGFDSKVSDIDLIAALAHDLSDDLSSRLEAMHDWLARAHPEWEERIEVVYVPAPRFETWADGIPRIAVIGPGEPFHTVKAGPERALMPF